MTSLDSDHCYRALCARDRRFDGVFFVGVETTGVYCRPVCSAKTPGRARCRFFASAAAAEQAGFRACLRCRPERAPGHAPVDRVPELVRRSLARIGTGALDHLSVAELAQELGVTDRHFRRTLEDSVGVSPVALAQSRRLGVAKWLLQDTSLSMTDIALAAGYGSIRRFNDAFSKGFGAAPSEVRRAAPRGTSEGVSLKLEGRAPFAGRALFAFLQARAIPHVEDVGSTHYQRFVSFGAQSGIVRAELDPERPLITLHIEAPLLPHLAEIVARLRALFDLDARPDLIDGHLRHDRRLARRVTSTPGLRVPGAFDPWELAARAVLGQQVSVKGATTLMGRLVTLFPGDAPNGAPLFPSAAEIARADVAEVRKVGLPAARAATLIGVARALSEGTVDLSRGSSVAEAVTGLTAIKGIGSWTASYVAMRALRDPDVFLAGDLGVRRALGVSNEKDASAIAEAWRPWRSYALMHLWHSEE